MKANESKEKLISALLITQTIVDVITSPLKINNQFGSLGGIS